jgi:hypothetical protein
MKVMLDKAATAALSITLNLAVKYPAAISRTTGKITCENIG